MSTCFLKKPENEELQGRREQERMTVGARSRELSKFLLIHESMGWVRSGSFNPETLFFEEKLNFCGKEAAFACVLIINPGR